MKKTSLNKKSKTLYASAKSKLDKVFSYYTRLRDSVNGKCVCVTCGEIFPIEKIDAGHFRSRNHMATRWDERNVHPQCLSCNRFQNGKEWEHGKYIDETYGEGTALELTKLSHTTKKYTVSEIKDLTAYYEAKIKEME